MSAPVRRTGARSAVVLALSAVLAAGALAPAAAAPTPGAPAPNEDLTPTATTLNATDLTAKTSVATTTSTDTTTSSDKLGDSDRDALAAAAADGKREVTVLMATAPGKAESVARSVAAFGGSVRYRNDKVGYVRAVLPTGAVERAARLRTVAGVDLNENVAVPDPGSGLSTGVSAAEASLAAVGPGPSTPAVNPYLPTSEIGATEFVRQHPGWDGRGTTIGILDTGVDLDHPALQTTSTGERKITDWFTVTDPLLDGDQSWRAMLTEVTGPSFTYAGRTWRTPAGTFRINRFAEASTAGGDSEYAGDVNRDGDTTDTWGVLYRESDHAIWVDTDADGDFTDEELRRPYGESYQVGHFGTDDPATDVQESVPFTVEYREDVDLSPAGIDGAVDFVNIGIVSNSHGSHVAGIAAGNNLFGGAMDGVAPGAKIVSARGCVFSGGCTTASLLEGMVELVTRHNVDVVNMSIGGLPALNDGSNARALLYNRLIDENGVQLFLSAGNEGPGVNTVGDPSVAQDVVSVGASVSRATWLSNYGAQVSAPQNVFNFSSRGPREDGGLKPNLTAPGAAVSTIPLWLDGSPAPEAGYALPPGYAMYNGTSMASPQAAGGAALLISAAKATEVPVTPAQLRTALYSSAKLDAGIPTYSQGVGRLRVAGAWDLLRGDDLTPGDFDISAGVCTPLSQYLVPPRRGVGIFNRCPATSGGIVAGRAKTYHVTITRHSGAPGSQVYALRWLGNDGTFSSPNAIALPRDEAVVLRVRVLAGPGAHSAVLQLDDPAAKGVEGYVPAMVVASPELVAPTYGWSASGRIERTRTQSYFVSVPRGAKALTVRMAGIAAGSQVRFLAFHPYGLPVDSTSSADCYSNHSDRSVCDPTTRTYLDPTPGVWELEVEARRTSPYLSNPFRLSAAVQGVELSPAVIDIPSAQVDSTRALSWTATNTYAPVTLTPRGGPLGSAMTARPTLTPQATDTYTVAVPVGATRLDVAIGNTSDLDADLDLAVLYGGAVVGTSADGDSEESVSLVNPPAGTYTVEVYGYDVPSGATEYDYRDVFYAGSLGSVDVAASPLFLLSGQRVTLTGILTVGAAPAAGRELFGAVTLETTDGAIVGRGNVVVRRVSPPQL